MKKKYLAIW